ncbi:MAG TPA: hypothetical protein PKN80_08650 [bacterium]|uniref:Uncharacterized protein n=1 Tax=candidate division TA06 bacterium ADurb.Bin417 TaxID=1852828 RepID=A0A1V5MDG2_UNCT6|nr:MAG: hypothetical protein BWY73_01158 [candidate division TA06 bacterium ADurb.Bin417]HNQ36115.1 hypothetical protein [bacterium]
MDLKKLLPRRLRNALASFENGVIGIAYTMLLPLLLAAALLSILVLAVAFGNLIR